MADGTLIITYDGDTERSFRLVGAFMHHWANIELGLDRAVRAVLRLGQTEGLVATANLTFPGKVRVISTALGQASTGGWAKDGSDVLKALTSLHEDRIMVAHDGFSGVPGGVVFYKVKAGGASKVPETRWAEGEFEKKFDALRELSGKLGELIDRLEKGAVALDPLPALSPTPAIRAGQSKSHRAPSPAVREAKPKPTPKSRKAAAARRRKIVEVKKPAAPIATVAPKPAPTSQPAAPSNGSNVQPLPTFGTPRPIV
jgi:hypothetical protein